MFMIGAGVLGSNVFNYIFPYSFGMLYGLLLILASVYSALNNRFFPAYFLYSLAICFKYEFIFLLPVLIWYSRKTNHFKHFLGLIFPFILTAIILITQGVTLDDIIASCQWVLAMSSTKTLDWFYGLSGIKFSLGLIPLYLLNLLKIIFPLVLLYYFRNIFTIIATLVYLSFFATPAIFIFIFPLILILGIIRYRDLKKKQIFLISASILVSFKVFFGFLMQSYGIFFIPFALIPVFVLFSKKLKKAFLVIIFLFAMIFGFRNAVSLTYKTAEVHSDSGILYTYNNYADSLNGLISYIKQNSKDTDIVVVYPEGLSLNFLTDRKSDNKFYSLTPIITDKNLR